MIIMHKTLELSYVHKDLAKDNILAALLHFDFPG